MAYNPFLRKLLEGAPLHAAHFLSSIVAALLSMLAVAPSNAWSEEQLSYGPWRIECTSQLGKAEKYCNANQLVTDGKDASRVVLGVMVGYMPEHPSPHIIFRLTPDANRDKGAAVKIDDEQFFNVPINECDERVCEVRSFIPEVLLSQMREGEVLKFRFFVDDKQNIFPVSLQGFNKAYLRLGPSSK